MNKRIAAMGIGVIVSVFPASAHGQPGPRGAQTLVAASDGTVRAGDQDTCGQLSDDRSIQRATPVAFEIAAGGDIATAPIAAPLNGLRPKGASAEPRDLPKANWERYGVVTSIFNPLPHVTRTKELGTGSVRLDFEWREIEHEPLHFQWHTADGKVERAEALGLKIFVTLAATPAWARATDCTPVSGYAEACPPSDMVAWQRFVEAVIDRYGNRVVYGIWNEPNLDTFLVDDDKATRYAQLFEYASRARQARNPNVILAGPETSHHAVENPFYFYRAHAQMMQWLAPQDIITVHWYPDGPNLGSYLKRVKKHIRARELWLTETGASHADERAQLSDVLRIVRDFDKQTAATKMFLYVLHDVTATHESFRIVNDDPPYYTKRQAFNMLRDYIVSRTMSGSDITLRTLRNYYVAAVPDGDVTVTSTSPQTMTVWDRNGGTLRSDDLADLTVGGAYFKPSGATLRANHRASVGTPETIFRIERVAGPGEVVSGDHIRLRSFATGEYLSATGGGGGAIGLTSTAGHDETFVVTFGS